MLALLFQFLSVFIFLLMAEFYCDQTLQFSSIYIAAEWIMKSAFKALRGAQRSCEYGLSTLVADEGLLQKGLSCKTYMRRPGTELNVPPPVYVNINKKRRYLSAKIHPNSRKGLFWYDSDAAPLKANFLLMKKLWTINILALLKPITSKRSFW